MSSTLTATTEIRADSQANGINMIPISQANGTTNGGSVPCTHLSKVLNESASEAFERKFKFALHRLPKRDASRVSTSWKKKGTDLLMVRCVMCAEYISIGPWNAWNVISLVVGVVIILRITQAKPDILLVGG